MWREKHRKKTGVKPSEQGENQQQAQPTYGTWPSRPRGPHWWEASSLREAVPTPEEKRCVGTVRLEASALTIAPSLLPSLSYDSLDSLIHSDHRCQSFPPAETVYPRFSPFKLLFWRVQLRNVVLTAGLQSRPTSFV